MLGETGRGALERCGVGSDGVVITGSLAKAIGCQGGFVAGPSRWIDAVRETAVYVGTSALPPAVADAARVAIAIVEAEPDRVARLRRNANALSEATAPLSGVAVHADIPTRLLPCSDARVERALRDAFDDAGIYAPCVRYPDRNAPPSFRLTVTSEHDAEDFKVLAAAVLDVTPDR